MPTQNVSYTYKIIKIYSSPKILKANQMLISYFPHVTSLPAYTMMRPRIICTYASKHTKKKSKHTTQIKITITMYTSLQNHQNNPMSTSSITS
jgi:hypothetical protein